MIKFFALTVLIFCSGCFSYTHTGANGEHTSIISVLNIGKASNIKSETIQEDYGRTVEVGSIEGKGDVDLMRAIIDQAIKSGAAGVKP